MRDEFLIERSGKQFVLYAGLLDEGHSLGLKRIETDLVQVPDEENGQVAIVKARAHMPPKDGEPQFFDGIGDASPDNVNRAIAKHLIRMAETRAKARALRDAINVGATAFEELGGDDEASTTTGAKDGPPRRSEANLEGLRGGATGAKGRPANAAKKEQRDRIHSYVSIIWPDAPGAALQKILTSAKVDGLDEMTQDKAAEVIVWLEGKLPEDEDFDEDAVDG